MRIGIDVDDVLNNSLENCLNLLNTEVGSSYTINDFTQWDVEKCIDTHHATKLNKLFASSRIWTTMLPSPDAQSFVSGLLHNHHEIYFVTASEPITHHIKSKWLKKMYPQVNELNHIFTYKKHLLQLDVLIDDNPAMLKDSLAHRILVNRPWNADARETFYEDRVNSLIDANEIIERLVNAYV